MPNENFPQNQNYIGIIKNNNVQEYRIGSCLDVLEWIWEKKNVGSRFFLMSPTFIQTQVNPNNFSQKEEFLTQNSNIPCLNNTIHRMVKENQNSST